MARSESHRRRDDDRYSAAPRLARGALSLSKGGIRDLRFGIRDLGFGIWEDRDSADRHRTNMSLGTTRPVFVADVDLLHPQPRGARREGRLSRARPSDKQAHG